MARKVVTLWNRGCSNHDPLGQGGATIRGRTFTQEYIEKCFLKSFSDKPIGKKTVTCAEESSGRVDTGLFNHYSRGRVQHSDRVYRLGNYRETFCKIFFSIT